jgi:hypothetical protein
VEQVIQRGVASGEVRAEGAEFYAALLVGMLRGLLQHLSESQRGEQMQEGARVLLHVFLKGIEV